jgi:hypothetical protein
MSLVVLATIVVCKYLLGGNYAADFHGGMWTAGREILAGHSPYPPPDAGILATRATSFVTPPLLGLVAVPFSVLPVSLTAVLWTCISVAGLAGALFLVGVRDARVYAVALCSFPFVESVGFGQSEGLLALSIACAWRYRDSFPGAVAVGVLIAAKLLAWPLILWLVVTRRTRGAVIATASALGMLFISWACVGFSGLAEYPHLLAADARAFEASSFSLVAGLMHIGVSAHIATLALIVTCVLALGAFMSGRRSDQSWFAMSVGFGVLSSPLVWVHYLVLLLVPLAIARQRLDPYWLATALLWFLPIHERSGLWQASLVLLTAIVIVAGSRAPAKGAGIHLRPAR